MFINFWYPAELASAVTTKPVRVKLLGQNFVVFRDAQGLPHCLANTCVHRCGSLSHGWTEGNNIVCPYHGWRFAGDGQCVRIPSLGPGVGALPTRARVDAYPTVERYGIVFVFLGDLPDEERVPILPISEWGDAGWRSTVVSWVFKANWLRVMDNALDLTHPEYVHMFGLKGKDPNWHVPDYPIDADQYGAYATLRSKPPPPSGIWRHLRKQGTEVESSTGFHGLNHVKTSIRITPRAVVLQYLYEAPIDELTTRTFMVSARSFLRARWLDGSANQRNMRVVEEDRAILEQLDPVRGSVSTNEDFSMRSDALSVHYRHRVAEYQARGWRIDLAALRASSQGTQHHVIPSPARRHSASWVFPPVPLLARGA